MAPDHKKEAVPKGTASFFYGLDKITTGWF